MKFIVYACEQLHFFLPNHLLKLIKTDLNDLLFGKINLNFKNYERIFLKHFIQFKLKLLEVLLMLEKFNK